VTLERRDRPNQFVLKLTQDDAKGSEASLLNAEATSPYTAEIRFDVKPGRKTDFGDFTGIQFDLAHTRPLMARPDSLGTITDPPRMNTFLTLLERARADRPVLADVLKAVQNFLSYDAKTTAAQKQDADETLRVAENRQRALARRLEQVNLLATRAQQLDTLK
jgi:hypothetical protein